MVIILDGDGLKNFANVRESISQNKKIGSRGGNAGKLLGCDVLKLIKQNCNPHQHQ